MYYLTVGAIFKNESHILKEWLDHYIYHGTEKFYLINDNSDDNFMDILQPYLDDGIVELFNPQEPKYDGRQSCLYVKYFLPKLKNKEMQWLALLDLDEFLYSPIERDLRKLLKQFENFGQIHVDWINFGSNGFIQQPKNVVESFTKCDILDFSKGSGPKNIINSNFFTVDLGIHESHVYGPRVNLSWRFNVHHPLFLINHYGLQSLEFWQTVKMTRGDADCHMRDDERDIKLFLERDKNIVEDLRLSIQNKELKIDPLKTSNQYNLELPENTFHKYCKNLLGGSKYGTDGILEYLMDSLEFVNKSYLQTDINDLVTLPCLYSDYKNTTGGLDKRWTGIIHPNSKISIPQYSGYVRINEKSLDHIPSKMDVVSCTLKMFEKHSISYYHLEDPMVLLLKLDNELLDTFLSGVKHVLEKKYTPIALCKDILICVSSEQVKLLNFPIIKGHKYTDYIDLYTNLYFHENKWYYNKDIEYEVAKRNFFKHFGRFSSDNNEDNKWISAHISKNKSLLWKPVMY